MTRRLILKFELFQKVPSGSLSELLDEELLLLSSSAFCSSSSSLFCSCCSTSGSSGSSFFNYFSPLSSMNFTKFTWISSTCSSVSSSTSSSTCSSSCSSSTSPSSTSSSWSTSFSRISSGAKIFLTDFHNYLRPYMSKVTIKKLVRDLRPQSCPIFNYTNQYHSFFSFIFCRIYFPPISNQIDCHKISTGHIIENPSSVCMQYSPVFNHECKFL